MADTAAIDRVERRGWRKVGRYVLLLVVAFIVLFPIYVRSSPR